MAAPTSEEIRRTVLHHWSRWRDPSAGDMTPIEWQPLNARLESAASFDLYCEVQEALYEPSPGDAEGPLDLIEREIMEPILAECDRRIMEGMAEAFERFAREYPDAPRATRKAVAS